MKNIIVTFVTTAAFLGVAHADDTASVLPQKAATGQQVVIINQGPDSDSAPLGTTDSVAQITPQAAPAAPQEIVKQPTTIIEATPLVTSRAEEMRKSREAVEVDTEQKIVERLEQSRIEAEKERQKSLLGAFDAQSSKKDEEPAPAVVVAPPVQQAIVPEAPKGPSLDDVRAAVHEELAAQAPKAPAPKSSLNFVSANIGMIDYSSADIRTIGALGVAFGKAFEDRWLVDVELGAANAYIDDTPFLYRKIDQFTLGVGTKFIVLPGKIRPTVGFLVNYVNRSYSQERDAAFGYNVPSVELRSWGIDYGLTAGLDVAVSENLSLGVEYKYMNNLTYEFSDEVLNTASYRNYQSAYGGDYKPLEERTSDFMGFSVKYLF